MIVGEEKMDYDKIGNFISKRRKEKGMTQNELALKLNLTDQAVSRWERGIGCPDISILESLAEILDVQVLEILRGEEIKSNTNKAVIDILKAKMKEIRLWKVISYVFLNILLIIFIGILIISHYAGKEIDLSNNTNIAIIKTPSMNPNFNIYDVVVLEKTDFKDIKVGDVIGFYKENGSLENEPIIHRVVEIDKSNVCLKTKGDNNEVIDEECVKNNSLIGVVSKTIPNIGDVMILFDNVNVPFKAFIILGILVIIFLDILPTRKYIINKKR